MTRTPRLGAALAVLLAALLRAVVVAPPAGAFDETGIGNRGWGYLIEKLALDGVDRERLGAVFRDPRIEPFDGLQFSLQPHESRSLYRSFLTPASIARARRCRVEHDAAFRAAERSLGVPSSIVAAILFIETQCGANTGSSIVLHRLARLAMANEPANLRINIERHTMLYGFSPDPTVEATARSRALYLEETFYPEVRATFELADRLGIDPLGIRGSPSGAFGLPQFLPTSYLRFALDGNEDGRVSLYDPDDAILSCANYLEKNGWGPRISLAEQRGVLWKYNRSTAYIDTVLALAARIEAPLRTSPGRRATSSSASHAAAN